MSREKAAVGRLIGEALAERAKDKPDSIVRVEPTNVSVSIKTDALANAMRDGAADNAKSILAVLQHLNSGVSGSFDKAVAALEDIIGVQIDLSGVECGLQALVDALGDDAVLDGLLAIVGALDAQTAVIEAQNEIHERHEAALRDQIAAIEENTAAIRADRTVSYDGLGRISTMKVVQ